jgi:hypothetical protein
MAQFGGGWRHDDTGVIAPFGGHGGEKELLRKGKDTAETMARARLTPQEGSLLALARSIAGDDEGTDQFIDNMSMASVGEYGFGRTEYNMGLTRMMVPSSMPRAGGQPVQTSNRRDHDGNKRLKEADVE